VGIDRLYEDDAPDVGHDSPAAKRDAPTAEGEASATVEHDDCADSNAERTAFNLKYRADVEALYQAAWDEAVPVFQANWEEHLRRYPHPERSEPTVHDDGSWSADGSLKLSPEQNAEVDRYCARSRDAGENVIEPAMRRVEAQDSSRHLEGLDNYLKGHDRLKEKVADELRPPSKLTTAQALSAVPDAVRFTLCYGESSYADGVRTDVERLKAQGFELQRLKNTWTKDQYKGINTQWSERESGVRFEVQFHTQVSFEAKELSHKAYERLRGSTAQDDEREELEAFQSAVSARIQIPQGATDIEDYPPEKRDG